MTDVATPRRFVPARRSASEAEIIDVDLFASPDEPPIRRRRISTTIDLTEEDSDDGLALLASGSRSSNSTAGSSRFTRRLPSLPPPPPADHSIPPVPPIPHEYRAYQSIPMRSRPPPMPRVAESGVVRPASMPFPFEANFMARHEGASAIDRPSIIRPAARSHHHPSMGLGGALISSAVRPTRRQHPYGPYELRRRRLGFMNDDHDDEPSMVSTHLLDLGARFARHLGEFFGLGSTSTQDRELDEFLGNEEPFARGIRCANRMDQPSVQDYKTSYTHPDKPAAGFSNDFVQSAPVSIHDLDSIGESSSQATGSIDYSTILVCACCLDPLVASESLGNTEEARLKRVYALRCGHMVDSKCIDRLIANAPSTPGFPLDSSHKGRGKGKGNVNEIALPGSIRSRLRSHASAPTPPPPALLIPRKPSNKGKGKAKEVIEDQREWVCPVEKCAKRHCNIKIEGTWLPAKENGPILLFL